MKVAPLEKKYRQPLAVKFCELYSSRNSPNEIAQHSRGYPGWIQAMANGTVEVRAQKVAGEEIDLSPLLLFSFAGIVALRYIGRGMDDTALYLLGGIGLAAVFVFRFLIYRGMK